jgi:hypothetical protein
MVWVLAFDLERDGPDTRYRTFALGASVVDSDFQELDSYLSFNLRARETPAEGFEDGYWRRHWSKFPEILEALTYHGELSLEDQERVMIQGFQEFRKKWELRALEQGETLELVCDNPTYDAMHVNILLEKHNAGLPLPFSALPTTTGDGKSEFTYGTVWDVFSMQKGWLTGTLPASEADGLKWGLSSKMEALFMREPPAKKYQHSHSPDHDAYTIAWDYQLLRAFALKDILLRAPSSKTV